jgi:hypothetical protein
MNPDGSDADADEPFPIGVSTHLTCSGDFKFYGIAHPPVAEHTPIRSSFHHLSAKELSIEFSRTPIHVEHDLDRHVGQVIGSVFNEQNGLILYCAIWDKEAALSVAEKKLRCLSLGVQTITDARTGDVQKIVKEVSLVEQSFHTGNLIQNNWDYVPPPVNPNLQKYEHTGEIRVVDDYETEFRGLKIYTRCFWDHGMCVDYCSLDASGYKTRKRKCYAEYTYFFTPEGLCFAIPKFETLASVERLGERSVDFKGTASMFKLFAARRTHRTKLSAFTKLKERKALSSRFMHISIISISRGMHVKLKQSVARWRDAAAAVASNRAARDLLKDERSEVADRTIHKKKKKKKKAELQPMASIRRSGRRSWKRSRRPSGRA